jgi:hypothetical protein
MVGKAPVSQLSRRRLAEELIVAKCLVQRQSTAGQSLKSEEEGEKLLAVGARTCLSKRC